MMRLSKQWSSATVALADQIWESPRFWRWYRRFGVCAIALIVAFYAVVGLRAGNIVFLDIGWGLVASDDVPFASPETQSALIAIGMLELGSSAHEQNKGILENSIRRELDRLQKSPSIAIERYLRDQPRAWQSGPRGAPIGMRSFIDRGTLTIESRRWDDVSRASRGTACVAFAPKFPLIENLVGQPTDQQWHIMASMPQHCSMPLTAGPISSN